MLELTSSLLGAEAMIETPMQQASSQSGELQQGLDSTSYARLIGRLNSWLQPLAVRCTEYLVEAKIANQNLELFACSLVLLSSA